MILVFNLFVFFGRLLIPKQNCTNNFFVYKHTLQTPLEPPGLPWDTLRISSRAWAVSIPPAVSREAARAMGGHKCPRREANRVTNTPFVQCARGMRLCLAQDSVWISYAGMDLVIMIGSPEKSAGRHALQYQSHASGLSGRSLRNTATYGKFMSSSMAFSAGTRNTKIMTPHSRLCPIVAKLGRTRSAQI